MGRRKKDDYSKSFRSIKDIQDKGYTISKNLLTEINLDNFKKMLKFYRFLDFENVLLFLSDFPQVLEFLVDFYPVIREYFPEYELTLFYYEDYHHENYELWISIMMNIRENLNVLRLEKLEEKFNTIADEDVKPHVSITSTPPL